MMSNKIGFFDSGMGGLSVLRDAQREMPEEDYIYYGDSAHAPYGSRTPQEIYELTMQCVSFLLSENIKALVIACNTATSVAIERIRSQVNIPVVGMEPAVKPALAGVSGKVLVLATPATIHQQRYLHLIQQLGQQDRIINCPCHRLAELVEKNIQEPDKIDAYLDELLLPFRDKVEGAVLGCTHYIFMRSKIAQRLPGTRLFDGNHGTVAHLHEVLVQHGIKAPQGRIGTVALHSSCNDPSVMETYTRLLNFAEK